MLEHHTKALCDLYISQHAARPLYSKSSFPHPRSASVSNFLDIFKKAESNKKKNENYDRGINTISDTYTFEQHLRLVDHFTQQNDSQGTIIFLI